MSSLGGLSGEGLQQLEILKHLPTDWVAAHSVNTDELSMSVQQQIEEWKPEGEHVEEEPTTEVKPSVDSEETPSSGR